MVDVVKIQSADGTIFDVAGDFINGVFYPVYKQAFGPIDSQELVTASNGLPVNSTDYYFEIGIGNIPNRGFIHKFGRNPDIDTTSGFETIWNGGGTYTGFNAVDAEIIEVFSASADDVGSVLSSGNATGGSATTIEDDTATFITDGVAAGDMIINDTQKFHGSIIEVTSEAELTVFRFDREGNVSLATVNVNDAYRIVTPGSTGASIAVLQYCLDADWNNETEEYVVLNGVTPVDTVNAYVRNSRSAIIHAGSGGGNAGAVTSRQKITPANVFTVMPVGYNRTMVAAYTIPTGRIGHILSFFSAIAGKTTAKSNVRLMARHFGEVFNVKEEFTIASTGAGHVLREYKVPKNDLPPRTDIMLMADTDANNTSVSGGIDIVLETELT